MKARVSAKIEFYIFLILFVNELIVIFHVFYQFRLKIKIFVVFFMADSLFEVIPSDALVLADHFAEKSWTNAGKWAKKVKLIMKTRQEKFRKNFWKFYLIFWEKLDRNTNIRF